MGRVRYPIMYPKYQTICQDLRSYSLEKVAERHSIELLPYDKRYYDVLTILHAMKENICNTTCDCDPEHLFNRVPAYFFESVYDYIEEYDMPSPQSLRTKWYEIERLRRHLNEVADKIRIMGYDINNLERLHNKIGDDIRRMTCEMNFLKELRDDMQETIHTKTRNIVGYSDDSY